MLFLCFPLFIHGLFSFLEDAFKQIADEMGAIHWSFNADLCEMEMGGISQSPPPNSDGYVECNCNSKNNTVCHVTEMYGFRSLPFIIIHPEFLYSACSVDVQFQVRSSS